MAAHPTLLLDEQLIQISLSSPMAYIHLLEDRDEISRLRAALGKIRNIVTPDKDERATAEAVDDPGYFADYLLSTRGEILVLCNEALGIKEGLESG